MTALVFRRQFVEALTEIAFAQVVASELETLANPPGRRPSRSLVDRANWYQSLDDHSRSMVANVMKATAYATLHRVLVVLDGGAPIDDPPHHGTLRLLWSDRSESLDLANTGDGPDLHDLLAEAIGEDQR